ncbi:hypothetical protein [Nocardia sp. IFM 10818]
MTRKATTIPGAQDAAQAVAEAARTVAELTTKLVKLRREFEETSRIRVRTRTQLQTDIDATEQELRTLKPQLPQLKTAARTAAAATGVPEEQWDEVVFEASERQQRQRMAAAQSQDQRDIGEDASYLRTLQRELGQVETEHARRATLTPEQREHEARTERDRTRTRRPMNPALGTWDGTDVSNPGPNFGHGTSRGQDQGLDL